MDKRCEKVQVFLTQSINQCNISTSNLKEDCSLGSLQMSRVYFYGHFHIDGNVADANEVALKWLAVTEWELPKQNERKSDSQKYK